jgi:uncharacterized membrane protein
MKQTTRQILAVSLGLAFVIWQALQDPGRSFAAILLAAAVAYAFGPVIRDGVA